MKAEKAKIRDFLLGESSEKDAEEIGLQILAEPGFDEKMSFAEESLIEDFLDNALTPQENELFKRNFLTTLARRELLGEIAQLRKYARMNQSPLAESESEEKKSGGFFEGFKGFLSLNLRPVAAVLIVLILAGIAWRVFLYEPGLTETEKNYAALNAKDLNVAPEAANLSSKSLIPGTMRGAGDADNLNSANLTENVLFRLALPAGMQADARFDLELVKSDKTMFRQTDLRVYQNPNGQELKVVLPKSILSKGNYQIKLNNNLTYGFAVE